MLRVCHNKMSKFSNFVYLSLQVIVVLVALADVNVENGS